MQRGKHWFDQNGGAWPLAACGEPVGDDWTPNMSGVRCVGCQSAVQTAIEGLRVPRPAAVSRSGVC